MPLKDVVKVNRKTFFNPTSWLGYSMLKSQFSTTWSVLRNLYAIPTVNREETFEQAMKRFGLTGDQVDQTAKTFLIYSIIFIICGVFTIGFSGYLLFHHASWSGCIIGIATTAVFFAYAFRYSFWRFEIKHRKLGCTFDEWLHGQPSNSERGPQP